MAHDQQSGGSALARFGGRAMSNLYHLYILVTLIGWVWGIAYSERLSFQDPFIIRTLVATLGLTVVVLLVAFIFFALNLSRKSRYSETLVNLHEVQFTLRELQTTMRSISVDSITDVQMWDMLREKIDSGLQRVLTQVVMAFGITSGTSCRASIKLLGRIDPEKPDSLENLYVRTAARDSASAHSCADKDAVDKEKSHRVSDNTDFERLIKGTGPYFFCGNINRFDGYENSSQSYWQSKRPFQAFVHKNVGFPSLTGPKISSIFPYSSVLTFPIKGDQAAERGIHGFLCVDSLSRKAFDERFDVPLCAAVANALYHPLLEYGALMTRIREKLKQEHT